MILTRLGNKRALAHKIIPLFPKHDLYIEPFFGAGGMFFSKPKAKFNILNDLDEEVYNLFIMIQRRWEDLYDCLFFTPIHEKLWEEWKKGVPIDPVWRAVRFLVLSNFSYLGQMQTLSFPSKNTKKLALSRLRKVYEQIYDVDFMCSDFKEVFRKIEKGNRDKAFVYADPPYLDTSNNYSQGFSEELSNELFETLQDSGIKWAMSEFDHPFILEQAEERDLIVEEIGIRRNLNNRRMEILVMNYRKPQQDLFSAG
ncbi:MAG: DNA adenine methylase [Balneola sp.]